MELTQAIKQVKETKEFKDWNKKNPDIFFSYALKMLENKNEQPWQLGFYHKSTDRIVTFIAGEDAIEMQQEEDIFKKPTTDVKKVDIEKVKIPFNKLLEQTKKFQKTKYPKELVNKTIAILQNLEKYGTIWNITYVTHSFNTLNIKVNVENGKIIHHSIESLMSFVKK